MDGDRDPNVVVALSWGEFICGSLEIVFDCGVGVGVDVSVES